MATKQKRIAVAILVGMLPILAGCPSNEPPKPEEVQPRSEMNKPSTGRPDEAAPGQLTPGQPPAATMGLPPGKGKR